MRISVDASVYSIDVCVIPGVQYICASIQYLLGAASIN